MSRFFRNLFCFRNKRNCILLIQLRIAQSHLIGVSPYAPRVARRIDDVLIRVSLLGLLSIPCISIGEKSQKNSPLKFAGHARARGDTLVLRCPPSSSFPYKEKRFVNRNRSRENRPKRMLPSGRIKANLTGDCLNRYRRSNARHPRSQTIFLSFFQRQNEGEWSWIQD